MKSIKHRKNKQQRKGIGRPKHFIWIRRPARKLAPGGFSIAKPRALNAFAHGTTDKEHFNPARFASALTESEYPEGFGLGASLAVEQVELAEWPRKKYESDDPSMKNLAARVDACKKDDRCRSPACPKCSHAAQAFITDVMGKFLSSHPDNHKIVCVSVVPRDGEIPVGQLDARQHVRNMRRWKDALARAGVTWFIGATDWSFNEHNEGRYKPSWQEHFYDFTVTDDPKQLRNELKEQFPATDAIPRPVQIKNWDGKYTAIAYMLKPALWRRIGTDEGERCEKGSKQKRECRATDKQPLRSAQKQELLMFLDQIGIQRRILMRWLQFINLADRGWTIVDRAPKGRMRVQAKNR